MTKFQKNFEENKVSDETFFTLTEKELTEFIEVKLPEIKHVLDYLRDQ